MWLIIAYRAALIGGPIIIRVASSGQPSTLQHVVWLGKALLRRLQDPDESDAALGAALSDASGRVFTVTTFADPFEVRKLQVTWGFSAGSPLGDDVRVCTFHFLRLSGGAPSSAWGASDFGSIETAFDTLWTSIKPWYRSNIILQQYRWYKDGPAIEPPQEPVRVVDRSVAGTMASTTYGQGVPPQVAVSVSEKTATRRHWGRFYLPQPAINMAGDALANNTFAPSGRFSSGFLTVIANAVDVFYEACLAAALPVVVYSKAKPEREGAEGTLPAQGALAITVDNLQVDDIPDVIRSRRFDAPTLRVQRAVGS